MLTRMASKVGKEFKTADAAAIAAIEEINPTSIKNKWEYAGRLYTRAGKFFFTRATTIRSPDNSDPGASIPTNVGIYHTHAGAFAPTDELFSPIDMLKATLGKELSYIGTPYQRILKFTPIDLLPANLQPLYPVGRVEVLRNVYVLPEIVIRA
jgi:hypothetical protein